MLNSETPAFLIVIGLSFAITVITTFIMDRVGQRLGIVARVGGRRQTEADKKQISKLGGVAIFLGFTITVIVAQFLNIPRFDDKEVVRFTGLIIGGVVIFLVGLIDDIVELKPIPIAIGQVIAASIAIRFDIFIETLNNPLTGQQTEPWPHIITVIITMLWLGIMMNTVNFMDGLDGLASGVAFIAGTMLFINSAFVLEPPQTSVSLLPLALIGTSFGFLLFNTYPARIIMGGGAIYLGYIIGSLSIIGGAKMATILLVMGLPLMDLAWQATNRLRQGRNPMHGDRGHVHYRLLDMGFSQRQIVFAYYVFCAVFGILTLVTASRLFKFIAMGIMLLLIAAGFMILARFNTTNAKN